MSMSVIPPAELPAKYSSQIAMQLPVAQNETASLISLPLSDLVFNGQMFDIIINNKPCLKEKE